MTDVVRIKRIYDAPETSDGARVLVDRLWPRGVRKSEARLDQWMKALAPSNDLRRWFAHDPERWDVFRKRYRDELAQHPEMLTELLGYCRRSPVTLLYASRDTEHNQAVVLKEVLDEEIAEAARPDEPASPVCWARYD